MNDKPNRTEEGKPRRRWFQFRLSTWFVLVAIVSWGMLLQPKMNFAHSSGPNDRWALIVSIVLDSPEGAIAPGKPKLGYDNCGCSLFLSSKSQRHLFRFAFAPKTAFLPIIALASFVGWKATWAIAGWRRNRSAHTV